MFGEAKVKNAIAFEFNATGSWKPKNILKLVIRVDLFTLTAICEVSVWFGAAKVKNVIAFEFHATGSWNLKTILKLPMRIHVDCYLTRFQSK